MSVAAVRLQAQQLNFAVAEGPRDAVNFWG